MRIAIVGLGGVGGYLAASFAKSGLDVTGFARGEHLKAIQKEGVRITEDEKEWRVPLHVKHPDEAEGIYDVVMFCVKSYDLGTSCKRMQNHINADSILLSFSNGVNNGDVLCACCDARVLDGCIYILSHIESPGVIRKKGKVFAALFGGEDERLSKLWQIYFKKPACVTKHHKISKKPCIENIYLLPLLRH
ncbi:ketopantoate reductase family protein [Sulfurimonas sp. NW9]|uniref:ketopantoate reductase family protein n=1 Tax=Sulfurimonas sp. NW9 TaxID=2922728 RepID=UPI003DA7E311